MSAINFMEFDIVTVSPTTGQRIPRRSLINLEKIACITEVKAGGPIPRDCCEAVMQSGGGVVLDHAYDSVIERLQAAVKPDGTPRAPIVGERVENKPRAPEGIVPAVAVPGSAILRPAGN